MAVERDPQSGVCERAAEIEPGPAAGTEPGRRIGGQITLIGAALAALIVVTVVAVLVAGSRTATFAEDSPEFALQRYLEAFDDGDYEAAYAYFSSSIREELSLREFEQSAEAYVPHFAGRPQRRVSVARVEETEDGVRLHLVVEEFYGDGFGGSTSSYERSVRMTLEDGAWKIDDPIVGLDAGPIPEFEEIPAEPAP